MERELWSRVVELVQHGSIGHRQRQRRFRDEVIVLTLLWAVLHDRPVLWSTDRRNWPFYMRISSRPSASTMSRRLRSPSVIALLKRIWDALPRSLQSHTALIIDAKPLPIGGYTKDRDARNGRACGCFCRGYKLYLVIDENSGIHGWKVDSMNVAEQTVAEELIPAAAHSAKADRWLLGDRIYDSNRLHAIAEACGLRLLTQRMRTKGPPGPNQTPGRLRAIRMLELPGTKAGWKLMDRRETVERYLGTLCCSGGGLGPLPGWVRGMRRVREWIGAKLLIHSLRVVLRRQSVA